MSKMKLKVSPNSWFSQSTFSQRNAFYGDGEDHAMFCKHQGIHDMRALSDDFGYGDAQFVIQKLQAVDVVIPETPKKDTLLESLEHELLQPGCSCCCTSSSISKSESIRLDFREVEKRLLRSLESEDEREFYCTGSILEENEEYEVVVDGDGDGEVEKDACMDRLCSQKQQRKVHLKRMLRLKATDAEHGKLHFNRMSFVKAKGNTVLNIDKRLATVNLTQSKILVDDDDDTGVHMDKSCLQSQQKKPDSKGVSCIKSNKKSGLVNNGVSLQSLVEHDDDMERTYPQAEQRKPHMNASLRLQSPLADHDVMKSSSPQAEQRKPHMNASLRLQSPFVDDDDDDDDMQSSCPQLEQGKLHFNRMPWIKAKDSISSTKSKMQKLKTAFAYVNARSKSTSSSSGFGGGSSWDFVSISSDGDAGDDDDDDDDNHDDKDKFYIEKSECNSSCSDCVLFKEPMLDEFAKYSANCRIKPASRSLSSFGKDTPNSTINFTLNHRNNIEHFPCSKLTSRDAFDNHQYTDYDTAYYMEAMPLKPPSAAQEALESPHQRHRNRIRNGDSTIATTGESMKLNNNKMRDTASQEEFLNQQQVCRNRSRTQSDVFDSFAMVKRSHNPKQDFKKSMMEMVMENGLQSSHEMVELLQCYLALNSDEYHDIIVKALAEVWAENIHHLS